MPKYQYIVEDNNINNAGSLILTLKPKKNSDIFNFKPGQYAMLAFYDSAGKLFINHPFSIASSPTQNNCLKFGIKVMGRFTQTLSKLKSGMVVDVMGPYGDFVFDENKYQDVVFIAGGVGITPFISAAYYATDKSLKNKINLIYSSRIIKDTLFYEDIKNLAKVNPNFKAKLKITNETVGEADIYCENGYITKETILENVDTVKGRDFFLCGPVPFMKVMENHLKALGVPSLKIHQEAFNVTPNLSFRKNLTNIFLSYGLAVILFVVFLGLIKFDKLKYPLFIEEEEIAREAPLSLINNIVSDRRNTIIASKELLVNTINTALIKSETKTSVSVVPTATPVVSTPVSRPIKTVTPIVSKPVVNKPVPKPVVVPRTTVS